MARSPASSSLMLNVPAEPYPRWSGRIPYRTSEGLVLIRAPGQDRVQTCTRPDHHNPKNPLATWVPSAERLPHFTRPLRGSDQSRPSPLRGT